MTDSTGKLFYKLTREDEFSPFLISSGEEPRLEIHLRSLLEGPPEQARTERTTFSFYCDILV